MAPSSFGYMQNAYRAYSYKQEILSVYSSIEILKSGFNNLKRDGQNLLNQGSKNFNLQVNVFK